MSLSERPKALLFDIGGVCVVSPFQAILDYELANSIPPGWVNFSISRSAPNGSWHQVERGEIPLDDKFFAAFQADLTKETLWRAFYAKTVVRAQARSNKEAWKSAEPDQPPLQTLAEAGVDTLTGTIPPVPKIDAKWLFWEMMRVSREPDPHMYPFLQQVHRLPRSERPLLAALSNTVIFPPSHPYSGPLRDELIGLFDVFISSAHVGLRKPDPKIFELVLRKMDVWDREHGGTGIKPGDVLFLDDIGENLRAGKKCGLRTLKVDLGKTDRAVQELKRILDMKTGTGQVSSTANL